jgi:hypothetical protein
VSTPAFHVTSVRRIALALLGTTCGSLLAASAEPPAAPAPVVTMAPVTSSTSSVWNLPDFIDRLPDFLADRLPGLEPSGAVRLYVRPHFGDFLHRDFVRIPVGVRDKVSETIEINGEVESYVTHGLADAAGYGFSNFKLGVKREHVLPALGNGGLSIGINYQTPLSRPPMDLTDGHRHFQPYVAATHPFVPAWRVLGYYGFGADFLDRTVLPAHFGRNQLHSNSLTFGAGLAHEWRRFHGSLTATVATSALMSDEARQVYSLRPEIVVPWKSTSGSATQILFTLGGRAIHGPDGNEFGVSGSMRVEFKLNRGAK